MSKTLHYGTSDLRTSSRIDRFVIRRRTAAGYDRALDAGNREVAASYARFVAQQVTPSAVAKSDAPWSFKDTSPLPTFGKRR